MSIGLILLLYNLVLCDVDNIYTFFIASIQARQNRPNSGGVAEGHPRFDKGGGGRGVAIFFYFLRVQNITF